MLDTELLMTDEFVAFSKKISELHVAKKTRGEELRKTFLTEMAKFDEQVNAEKAKFDAFVASHKKGPVDKK